MTIVFTALLLLMQLFLLQVFFDIPDEIIFLASELVDDSCDGSPSKPEPTSIPLAAIIL